MKILLLGKNGQVGWELQRALAPLGELVSLGRQEQVGLCGDLTNLEQLKKTVLKVNPDVIVNAAAYTAVDKAESETELAYTVNAAAPELLAELSKKLDALLVHYSTDYVFDGLGKDARQEADKTSPQNAYGLSKLNGELSIERSGCKYLIFRTSWVFGVKGNNFAKTMMNLASDRDELYVISDQVGAPTSAELIANVTADSIRDTVLNESLSGLYHLTAAGETSWYEYAQFVIEQARANGQDFQVKAINGISTAEYPTPAKRPLNSRLDCAKLKKTFSIQLPCWKAGVIRMLTEIKG
jgi:dTDP-4-dehydrorhamnose reductase